MKIKLGKQNQQEIFIYWQAIRIKLFSSAAYFDSKARTQDYTKTKPLLKRYTAENTLISSH